MKNCKKILSLLLTVVTCLTLAVMTGCNKKTDYNVDYNIGILQIDTHTALDNARQGFEARLNEWAKEKGKTIKFDEKNAKGDQNNEKSYAQNLVKSNNNILLGIATSSARALATETTKIPVLFTAVTDPERSGLTSDDHKNVTGTSDAVSTEAQIEFVRKIVPNCKKIGLMYCSNEENSLTQIEAAEKKCKELGIQSQRYSVDSTSNIQTTVESISSDVEAVYIPTDNLLAANMTIVSNHLTSKGIPIIASESGMCEDNEAVATLGLDYCELGRQTAEIAIQILEGKSPSEIPFETYNQPYDAFINVNNAKKLMEKNPSLKLSDEDIKNILGK